MYELGARANIGGNTKAKTVFEAESGRRVNNNMIPPVGASGTEVYGWRCAPESPIKHCKAVLCKMAYL